MKRTDSHCWLTYGWVTMGLAGIWRYVEPASGGPSTSDCDVNLDSSINVSDVQMSVNQAIGISACSSDINKDGRCDVVDVQRVVNAALGGPCVAN